MAKILSYPTFVFRRPSSQWMLLIYSSTQCLQLRMCAKRSLCLLRKQLYFWLTPTDLVVLMIWKPTTSVLGITRGNLCESTRLSDHSRVQCTGLTEHRNQELISTSSLGCTTTMRVLLNSGAPSSMHMVSIFLALAVWVLYWYCVHGSNFEVTRLWVYLRWITTCRYGTDGHCDHQSCSVFTLSACLFDSISGTISVLIISCVDHTSPLHSRTSKKAKLKTQTGEQMVWSQSSSDSDGIRQSGICGWFFPVNAVLSLVLMLCCIALFSY